MSKHFTIAAIALTVIFAAPASAGVAFGVNEVGASQRYQQPYNNNPNPKTVTSRSPQSALEIRKIEGKIIALEQEARTLTVESATGEIQTLGFMVPAGAETIKTTKKAAKTLGKKSMRFNELRRGTEVKTTYYAALDSMETIVVTRPVLTEGTTVAD